MTLEQAKNLQIGDMLHHNENKNADRTCQRWKVNGNVKTWKRDASRISVPLKCGMWGYFTLTERELDLVHLASDECKNRS